MTVEQMLKVLQKLKDAGYGNIKLAVPMKGDDWDGVSKLQYKPIIDRIIICTTYMQTDGIDINNLLGGQQHERN